MIISQNTTLMRQLIDKMDYMVRVMDYDHTVIYTNKKMKAIFGDTMGHHCYELLGLKNRCAHCITTESTETGKPETKDANVGGKCYNVMSSPVSIADGEKYSIEIFNDITEQKEIERELISHYEKLKADVECAKNVQHSALPIDGVYWNSMSISSIYLPSEDLGGDFFDIIKVDENKTLLYIADISGHGVRSSLLTVFLRQLIRGGTLWYAIDLIGVLDVLLKSYNDLITDKEQYLSALFCCYDKEKKEVAIINAGHNCLPVLIKKDGEIKEIVVRGMPVCNLVKEADHEQIKIKVESGDRILLYTDGISEVCDEERRLFGSEGVIKSLKNNIKLDSNLLAKKIIEDVREFSDAMLVDDMALVVADIL